MLHHVREGDDCIGKAKNSVTLFPRRLLSRWFETAMRCFLDGKKNNWYVRRTRTDPRWKHVPSTAVIGRMVFATAHGSCCHCCSCCRCHSNIAGARTTWEDVRSKAYELIPPRVCVPRTVKSSFPQLCKKTNNGRVELGKPWKCPSTAALGRMVCAPACGLNCISGS